MRQVNAQNQAQKNIATLTSYGQVLNIDEVLSISNRVLEYKFDNKFQNPYFLSFVEKSGFNNLVNPGKRMLDFAFKLGQQYVGQDIPQIKQTEKLQILYNQQNNSEILLKTSIKISNQAKKQKSYKFEDL